jgi:hypothetical protein
VVLEVNLGDVGHLVRNIKKPNPFQKCNRFILGGVVAFIKFGQDGLAGRKRLIDISHPNYLLCQNLIQIKEHPFLDGYKRLVGCTAAKEFPKFGWMNDGHCWTARLKKY